MSEALTLADDGRRTTLRFQTNGSPWPIIDGWAMRKSYARQPAPGDGERHRVYQKGSGLLVAPMMLEVVVDGDAVTLQAWVRMTFFVRLMAFFILPAELGIKSGGFKAALPRSSARKAVNELLAEFGQQPIP